MQTKPTILTRTLRSLSRSGAVLTLLALPWAAGAQKGIYDGNVVTSSQTGSTYTENRAPDGVSGIPASATYRFGNSSGYTDNKKQLTAFSADGKRYAFVGGTTPTIKIRRKVAAFEAQYKQNYPGSYATPMARDLGYFEGAVDGTNVNIKSPYIPKMEDLFVQNDVGVGIDNLFANDNATNTNNVERLDVIYPSGYNVSNPTIQGFGIFERGVYGAHDPSVIAVITGIDGSGKPSAFATKLIQIKTTDYNTASGTNSVYQPSTGYVILRRDRPTDQLAGSDLISSNQGIGGVLLTFADFGIAPGTTIYGYAVLANDFYVAQASTDPARDAAMTDGTAAGRAVDFTNNTYFPNNTGNTTGTGGIDMATITGIVQVVKISGNVYNDVNGLTDNLVDGIGIGTPGGTQIHAILVGSDGNVISSVPVNSNGSFVFLTTGLGNMSIRLSTTAGTPGATPPTAGLPAGWVSTGANYGSDNDGGTGNINNSLTHAIGVKIGSLGVTGIRFGIEQIPTAGSGTHNAGDNPGGTTQETVPNTAFTSTTNSTDPSPGAVTGIRITAFPSGATSIVVNGITYTDITTLSTIIIPTDASGNPTWPITVDPDFDGSGDVVIPFVAVDAAGKESSNIGNAVIHFTVSISGNVFHDANGLNGTPANTVDGPGTNAGGLNAILVDNSGNVVAFVPVQPDGTFTFTGRENGTYSVRITTNNPTLGQPAPAVLLPTGWVSTGEHLGAIAGNDGIVNGNLPLGAVVSRVTNANFGIEQTATADFKTYMLPGGTADGTIVVSQSTPSTDNTVTTPYTAVVNMSGTASTGAVPGQLTGTDPDGGTGLSSLPLGSGTMVASVVINPTTFVALDGSNNPIADGLMLEYNGVQLQQGGCKGTDIGKPECNYYDVATGSWIIPNYDESKLKILAMEDVSSLSFSYSWQDEAGKIGSANSYNIGFNLPLPIRLVSFGATASDYNAALSWTTGAELNSYGFGIERSKDGRVWSSVGYVKSIGATATGHDYSYVDEQPGEGVQYYRLKLEDQDGSYTYSAVRQVRIKGAGSAISIYPNPAANYVRVAGADVRQIVVLDVQGRVVALPQAQVQNSLWNVETSGLANGMYTLQIFRNGAVEQHKLIIKR